MTLIGRIRSDVGMKVRLEDGSAAGSTIGLDLRLDVGSVVGLAIGSAVRLDLGSEWSDKQTGKVRRFDKPILRQ